MAPFLVAPLLPVQNMLPVMPCFAPAHPVPSGPGALIVPNTAGRIGCQLSPSNLSPRMATDVPQNAYAVSAPPVTAARNPARDLREAKGGFGKGGVYFPNRRPKTDALVSHHERLCRAPNLRVCSERKE